MSKKKVLCCSFCQLPEPEVNKLFQSELDETKYICNFCVGFAKIAVESTSRAKWQVLNGSK